MLAGLAVAHVAIPTKQEATSNFRREGRMVVFSLYEVVISLLKNAYQIEVLHKIFFFVKFKHELVLTSVEIMNELALRKVCFAFNMV